MKQLIYLFIAVSLFACNAEQIVKNQDSDTLGENTTLSGSYAKILQINGYVYAIDQSSLTTFLVTENGLEKLNAQDVGFNIENLFSYEDLLFIGSQRGMFIYQINNDGIPVKKAQENYFSLPDMSSCDPVIANANYAYVTLMTNTEGECRRSIYINELRIYDVTNISEPLLVSVTPMEGPKGLGLKDNLLFVCDGENGVQILNVADKANPEVVNTLNGFKAFDLIINGNKLSVIGDGQLKQFDITDPMNIIEYSTIILT